MAVGSSSGIRFSGLNSGLDTEALVQAMSGMTKLKIDNNTKKIQSLQWKQEAYRDVISKITDLQNKFFDSLKPTTNLGATAFLNTYKVSGDTKGLNVTTTSSSIGGNFKVKVQQLATKSTYKGSSLSQEIKLNLDKAQAQSDDNEYKLNITVGSITKEVSFSGATSEEIATSFNDSVKNAFGTVTGGKGFVEMDADGKITINGGQTVRITENKGNFGMLKAENAFYLDMSNSVEGPTTLTISKGDVDYDLTFDTVGKDYFDDDSDTEKNDLFTSLKTQAFVAEKAKEGNENLTFESFSYGKNDAVKDLNKSKLMQAISEHSELNDLKFEDGILQFEDKSEFTIHAKSGSDLSIVKGSSSNVTGTYTSLKSLGIEPVLSDPSNPESEKIYQFNINGVNIKLAENATISGLMAAVNRSGAGVNMTYSTNTDSLVIESTTGGNANNINISNDAQDIFTKLGFAEKSEENFVAGKNAIFTVNGKTIESVVNSHVIDGTTIAFDNDVELNKEITFSTVKDNTTTKEAIKAFVEDYNKMVEDVFKYLTQKPNSKYTPLTDEEKEGLTETQIEKLEAKAKEGILYQDSAIRTVMANMRTALYSSIKLEDGSTFGIYQMGITTSSNWTDNGKLVLDEAKLEAALTNDFDKVQALFTDQVNGAFRKLNTEITNAVKATGTRESKGSLVQIAGLSTGTALTDNKIYDEIKRLNDSLSILNARYTKEQDRYWKQFTALEKQMAELNSQTSSLSGLLNF